MKKTRAGILGTMALAGSMLSAQEANAKEPTITVDELNYKEATDAMMVNMSNCTVDSAKKGCLISYFRHANNSFMSFQVREPELADIINNNKSDAVRKLLARYTEDRFFVLPKNIYSEKKKAMIPFKLQVRPRKDLSGNEIILGIAEIYERCADANDANRDDYSLVYCIGDGLRRVNEEAVKKGFPLTSDPKRSRLIDKIIEDVKKRPLIVK